MVVCTKCDYEWDYGGGLDLATCPNCNHKNPVEQEATADG